MSKRPNFLIFMSDHMNADVVNGNSCYMPNAKKLAKEGILFKNAYCPTAHCCPSRATFFTGVYPSKHGIYNNVLTPTAIHSKLNSGVITFSELLKLAGYRLIFTGKWHVSAEENPVDRGWEELMVTCKKTDFCGNSIIDWRNDANTKDSDDSRQRGQILRPGWGDYQLYKTLPTDDCIEKYDYKVVDSAIQIIPELARDTKPWCLYVGVNGPHDPYVVPEQFVKLYDSKQVKLPHNFIDNLEDKPRIYQRLRQERFGQLTEDEVREAIAHYWAYCSMEDALFGEILKKLEETGQMDNTVIVFLSDHGDYCGAHGLFTKGVPSFREAYNIPCIIRYPKGINNPCCEVNEFVSLADFTPTFLELADVSVPDNLTGRSIVPFLKGEVPKNCPDAFYSQFNGVELYYTQRIVATKDFKYVFNGFDFDELYDLKNDPYELVNLSQNKNYEEAKHNLVKKMWKFAMQENDEIMFNQYITVGLAPWGPKDAI